MPYYALQLYIEDINDELVAKKKAHEEQLRQQKSQNRPRAPRPSRSKRK